MNEETGKLRGRRGAVLLATGALLGAVIVGPGATIAQKMTQSTTKTKFIRTGTILTAGKTETAPIGVFSSSSFTPIATANVKVPGPGFLHIVGSLSAKDDAPGMGDVDGKLQYRLKAGNTPLTTVPEAYELFLPVTDERQNGTVNGVLKVNRKGTVPVSLEAQEVSPSDASIHGRSVTAIFIPKGKLPKTKKKQSPTGTTPVGP